MHSVSNHSSSSSSHCLYKYMGTKQPVSWKQWLCVQQQSSKDAYALKCYTWHHTQQSSLSSVLTATSCTLHNGSRQMTLWADSSLWVQCADGNHWISLLKWLLITHNKKIAQLFLHWRTVSETKHSDRNCTEALPNDTRALVSLSLEMHDKKSSEKLFLLSVDAALQYLQQHWSKNQSTTVLVKGPSCNSDCALCLLSVGYL